ncbi:MAG: hypothetical protein OIF57_06725 [Marinobacterium sp.]|nr:hypothetical protein [Marinobacterium sp.]
MSTENEYEAQVADIQQKANAMHATVIEPQLDGNEFISDNSARAELLNGRIGGSIFESAGGGNENAASYVATSTANAIRSYYQSTGRMPDVEVLATTHDAINNLYSRNMASTFGSSSLIAENAGFLSTTEGIPLRDHLAALIMPVALSTITSAMSTSVPATKDTAEIYRITRVAASTFGDLNQGDVIDEAFSGQYSAMDHIKPASTPHGDGSKRVFELDAGVPLKKGATNSGGYVKVYLGRKVVAVDNGSGVWVPPAGEPNPVPLASASAGNKVDYAGGKLSIEFATAPASGVEIHFSYDVNIEARPELIPLIDHQIESWTMKPHESALGGVSGLQSLMAMQREFNVNTHNLILTGIRQIVGADKDRKNLRLMYFAAQSVFGFDAKCPDGLRKRDHYETVDEVVSEASTYLLMKTKVSGMKGMIAGIDACRFWRTLPSFKPAPGYRESPQPHYVGTVEGKELYCDPGMADPVTREPMPDMTLCYAKGRNHSQAGLVVASAIPLIPLRQDTRATNLKIRDTAWSLDYRDIHPGNGEDFFTWIKIRNFS